MCQARENARKPNYSSASDWLTERQVSGIFNIELDEKYGP